MPIDFQIDHSAKRVIARTHGTVTMADVLAYFDAISVEDAAAYPKLFDAREGTVELSDEDMMVLGARASAYAAFRPGPTALVVDPTAEATPFVRRYQNLAKRGREVEVFESRDRAEDWLWKAATEE